MLGQVEIDTFWQDVERHLTKRRPRLSPEQAVRAIQRYRNALDVGGVKDMVYHREPQQVAADIVAGEFEREQ
jgi:hypothetical protein